MIKLYNKQTNEFLGRISEEQFRFLADRLEEESIEDRDYYITRQTVDGFAEQGADEALINLLRYAMKPAESVELRWEKDNGSTPLGS